MGEGFLGGLSCKIDIGFSAVWNERIDRPFRRIHVFDVFAAGWILPVPIDVVLKLFQSSLGFVAQFTSGLGEQVEEHPSDDEQHA